MKSEATSVVGTILCLLLTWTGFTVGWPCNDTGGDELYITVLENETSVLYEVNYDPMKDRWNSLLIFTDQSTLGPGKPWWETQFRAHDDGKGKLDISANVSREEQLGRFCCMSTFAIRHRFHIVNLYMLARPTRPVVYLSSDSSPKYSRGFLANTDKGLHTQTLHLAIGQPIRFDCQLRSRSILPRESGRTKDTAAVTTFQCVWYLQLQAIESRRLHLQYTFSASENNTQLRCKCREFYRRRASAWSELSTPYTIRLVRVGILNDNLPVPVDASNSDKASSEAASATPTGEVLYRISRGNEDDKVPEPNAAADTKIKDGYKVEANKISSESSATQRLRCYDMMVTSMTLMLVRISWQLLQ